MLHNTGSRSCIAAWPPCIAALFCGLFWMSAVFPQMTQLPFNPDEGVNLIAGSQILAGFVPFRDFFYHQFPVYIYFLAGGMQLGIHSLFSYRLISLCALALTGILLNRFVARRFGLFAGFLTQVTFYLSPVHWDIMTAMPNALSILLLVAGILILYSYRPVYWAAALFWGVSVFLKPNLAPAMLALVWVPQKPWHQVWALTWRAIIVGLFFFGIMLWLSDGTLGDILLFQWQNHSGNSGFANLVSQTGLGQIASDLDITSGLDWNWMIHRQYFLRGASSFVDVIHSWFSIVWLLNVGTVLSLVYLVARISCRIATSWDWIAAAPLTLLILFHLLLISPAWPHYLAFYTPFVALSIIFGICVTRVRSLLLVWAIALCIFLPQLYAGVVSNQTQIAAIKQLGNTKTKVLSFNPTVMYLLENRPLCGLTDPSNIFGSLGDSVLGENKIFSKFVVSSEDIWSCMSANPDIRLYVGDAFYLFTFTEAGWCDWLSRQPPDRLIYQPASHWVDPCRST